MTEAQAYRLLLRGVTRAEAGDHCGARQDACEARAAAARSGGVQLLAARLLAYLHDYRSALDATAGALALQAPAAALERYQLARDVGWYPEARTVLEHALRDARSGAAAGGRIDRLLQHAPFVLE
jgi:hypothetical protein